VFASILQDSTLSQWFIVFDGSCCAICFRHASIQNRASMTIDNYLLSMVIEIRAISGHFEREIRP
jgi:hypothetical protein